VHCYAPLGSPCLRVSSCVLAPHSCALAVQPSVRYCTGPDTAQHLRPLPGVGGLAGGDRSNPAVVFASSPYFVALPSGVISRRSTVTLAAAAPQRPLQHHGAPGDLLTWPGGHCLQPPWSSPPSCSSSSDRRGEPWHHAQATPGTPGAATRLPQGWGGTLWGWLLHCRVPTWCPSTSSLSE